MVEYYLKDLGGEHYHHEDAYKKTPCMGYVTCFLKKEIYLR